MPRPQPEQLLVRVRAIGLNFADILARWGVYPGTPRPPFVPGLEFSGDVVAVGHKVRMFRGGERVMGYSRLGSHAEYVSVDPSMTTHLPGSMTYEEGAGFLVSSMTAYHGLVQLSNTRRGERVLVHAAAGGVGTATVQLAKYLGAQVFATAGTSEKISVARAQGADYAINYRSTDFAKEIQRITDSYGVDVVMDSVGGGVFGKSWSLLAEMGRYVLFGLSSLSGKGGLNPLKTAMTFARMVPIVPAALISSNKALLGFNLGTLKSKVEYFQESGGELIRLQAKGVLRPVIGKVFHFRDIVAAHHALQTRQTIGKVIVVVD